jgi:formate hydrogenlyase transcriptional activator
MLPLKTEGQEISYQKLRAFRCVMAHREINFSNWLASWISMEDYRPEDGFEEIVGDSQALNRMLKLAMKVARSDAPVLILGEGGSGKELIARAIHRISARKDQSFVKVNCTAEPSASATLERHVFGLESDGQDEREKFGYVELANGGTLFLDEIAHLSLDLQAKLLQLLERREIERVGGKHGIGVNVRVIATTQYDLGEHVAKEMFRGELYDQLNVFPVQVPALRERRDDIPLLVRYFMQKFARRLNKHIETIPADTLGFLTDSDWPDNVRQLENLIERSVILTEGSVLRVPWSGLQPGSGLETS